MYLTPEWTFYCWNQPTSLGFSTSWQYLLYPWGSGTKGLRFPRTSAKLSHVSPWLLVDTMFYRSQLQRSNYQSNFSNAVSYSLKRTHCSTALICFAYIVPRRFVDSESDAEKDAPHLLVLNCLSNLREEFSVNTGWSVKCGPRVKAPFGFHRHCFSTYQRMTG